jgi:hypothetical protein
MGGVPRGVRGRIMADDRIEYAELFNPRPIGERVNVYVHHVAPEKEPDYTAMQRFIDASADSIRTTKTEK